MIRAFAPGRVNLIGDHTDYTGGLVLPCAIDLGTTVTLTPGGKTLELRSQTQAEEAVIELPVRDPAAVSPAWGRYAAAVAAELGTTTGGRGSVDTTLPIGSGLSSSAAFEVAVALVLGFVGTAKELAQLCQRAEQRAVGVPCGVMDQLASAAGLEGHALLIDCATLETTPIAIPEAASIVVVDSGEPRSLAGSEYAERRRACEAAAAIVGPLRAASLSELANIADPVVARRARHVITENRRVEEAALALRSGDLAAAGRAMTASHASLRDDYEVSTPRLDALVDGLAALAGVHGARLTGAGFGGCAVALVDAGRARAVAEASGGLIVRPSGGARLR